MNRSPEKENIPLISVIIPVYNTEKYIARCLDSVLGNTYEALEVLCINDGSTDGSAEILRAYAEKDKRVRVLTKENGGVSAARNDGIRAATGEFAAFIDADDWVHSQYFECMMTAQKKSGADVLGCGYCLTGTYQMGERFDCSQVSYTTICNALPAAHIRYIGGLMYRSSLLRQCSFPTDIRIAEDLFFNTVLITGELDRGHSICFAAVDRVLYYYFQHADSALKKTTSHAFGQIEAARRYAELAKTAKTETAKAIYAERACKAAFLYRYLEMFSPKAKTARQDAGKVYKPAVRILRSLRSVSTVQKITYTLFAKFPVLYRLSRIAADRTLLDWEKNQRRERALRRRNAR